MRYEIHGTTLQTLDIYLNQGESVFTESGGMAWMVGNIDMNTSTRCGLLQGLGRSLAGESLFLTTYTCSGPQAMITFTPEAPGSIVPVELKAGESRICQKDAFMVAEHTVTLEMHFRKKLGAGLFGGEGFVLQKITGPGTAWVEISGEVRAYTLQAGQTIKVDPGHIAMYEPTVNYDIQRVKGVKNILFGGEGLFLATLTGPGQIWLQSLPLSNLASKLAQYMPVKSG
ncbi:MAG: TIGR00266 family protein [Chloroflexi bacterium]|nr:TIGR00266 family protein [Chloroflexota bacterium]MCI0649443.1 TIGR00266 family protein [Chloroflexota bacterium]MCI0730757.1 TIGR00266 family protein [Chloroflexota bacterium]